MISFGLCESLKWIKIGRIVYIHKEQKKSNHDEEDTNDYFYGHIKLEKPGMNDVFFNYRAVSIDYLPKLGDLVEYQIDKKIP